MTGSVIMDNSNVYIDVGEIKSSSSSYGHAINQLVLRAKVYAWVGSALANGRKEGVSSVLRGRVFVYGNHEKNLNIPPVQECNGVVITREIVY
jgi:hypothetical protein